MSNRVVSLLILFFLFANYAYALNPSSQAPNFKLLNSSGTYTKLSDYKGKVVVLEWFNEYCPFVTKYYHSGFMQYIQKEVKKDKDVVWLTIVSSGENRQGYYHTPEEAQSRIKKLGMNVDHILLDKKGDVAISYDAKVTPHIYIIDREGIIRYTGSVDSINSLSIDHINRAKNFIVSGVKSVVAGKKPHPSKTKPLGCMIKFRFGIEGTNIY